MKPNLGCADLVNGVLMSRTLQSPGGLNRGCPEKAFLFGGVQLLVFLASKLLCCLVAMLAMGLSMTAMASGETLEVRNTSPLAQLYGLPPMRGARAEGVRIRFDVDVANSFTGDLNDSEFVFLDGETSTFSYTLKRGWSDRWEVGLELPWVVHSGGRFDRLIDDFHDLFGLPDGGRPLAERGAVDFVIRLDGRSEVALNTKTSDLGDVRGWLAYELYDSPQRSLVSRVHAKLPTGRARNLSGSGGTDLAVGLDYVDHALFARAGVQLTVGGGISYLGTGDLLPDQQNSFVPYAHLGLARNIGWHNRVRFLGQLDAHGALFDARLSHLGHSVLQGTLGFQFDLTAKARLGLVLIEDLSGAGAADVIFKLSLVGQL